MRHRSGDDNDDSHGSLELLLDTMCNAFGGIIFIAMLLSVMSLTGGVAKKAGSVLESVQETATLQLERISQESEIRELKAEIESARMVTEQQKKSVALMVKEADIPLLARLASLQVKADSMDEEFKRILKLMSADKAGWEKALRENPDLSDELQTKEKKLEKAEKERDKAVADKKKEEEKAEKELDAEKKKRQRSVRLPKIHSTDKVPFWVILKGGHLYLMCTLDQSGDVSGLNERQVNARIGVKETEITVRPGTGQRLRQGAENVGNLRQIVRDLNKSKHFVWVAVYPDSYPEFHTLRNTLLKHGFGYHCSLMREGQTLVLVPGTKFSEQ